MSRRGLVWIGRAAVAMPLLAMLGLVVSLVAAVAIDPRTGRPDEQMPIWSALFGSLGLTLSAAAAALPVGLATALYLEAWPRTWTARWCSRAMVVLAGLPPISFAAVGALVPRDDDGQATFGRLWVVLTMVTVPVAVQAARAALRRVPTELRAAAQALGATRLTTLRDVVLPTAGPALLAGALLAVARAMAETVSLLGVEAGARGAFPLLGPYAFRLSTGDGQLGAAALAILTLIAVVALLHFAAHLAEAEPGR